MKNQTATKVEGMEQNPVPTIIEFLLDETGSMSSCKSQTISGFNEFISQQRETPGTCLFTLTKFDSQGQRNPYTDLDLHMVPFLNDNTFQPGMSTNLRDTILSRISHLNDRLKFWDVQPRILFIVMTDGGDNSSRHSICTTRESVATSTEMGWTFVYLGANQSAEVVARELGFLSGNIRSFATEEMHTTMTTLSNATVAYRSTAVSGSATRNFYDNKGI